MKLDDVYFFSFAGHIEQIYIKSKNPNDLSWAPEQWKSNLYLLVLLIELKPRKVVLLVVLDCLSYVVYTMNKPPRLVKTQCI